MSQSVNVNFAKCFIIFMAIVILLQGVIYLGLAIWGVTLYNCDGENSDAVNKPFEFVLNLIYFSSEKCGPPVLHVEAFNEDLTLRIDYSVAEVISNREFIFFITYIVISTLWVVTSLMILVTICGAITKTVAAVCFWPWLACVLAGSILDVVASGYHIHDIIHTTSAEAAFQYVGVENSGLAITYLQGYDVYFMTPALTFTLISSRVVLIWLLNIFGSIFCLSLARVLSSNHAENKRQQQNQIPAAAIQPQNDDRQMREIQQQDTVALRYQPSAPEPDSIRKDRRTMEPPPHSPQDEVPAYALAISRQQSTTKNKRVDELKTQASITTDTPTYQSSEAHPENLDYPISRHSTITSQPTPRSATPELSAISPLNMRYSTADGLPFPNQPHITQELRGQLPWSYTNIMNDPIAQKRIQSHLQPDDDDAFPPIPVPDYTLHPPKKDRSSVSQDRLSQSGYSRW